MDVLDETIIMPIIFSRSSLLHSLRRGSLVRRQIVSPYNLNCLYRNGKKKYQATINPTKGNTTVLRGTAIIT